MHCPLTHRGEELDAGPAAAAARDDAAVERAPPELGRVRPTGVELGLMEREARQEAGAAHVPQLKRVRRPPRTRQDHIVRPDVHAVAAAVRAVDRPHGALQPRVPYLHRVVPAPGDEQLNRKRGGE